MDFSVDINGRCLEYYDTEHIYLVDGVIVPSVTQLLAGNEYEGVDRAVLMRAARHGTRVHEAIQRYCETGAEEDLEELRNFKFLQRQYKFGVKECEVPVIIDIAGITCAGRLDMVLLMDKAIGGADIKCTATLNKEKLAYQLNLYRIGYRQCYGIEWNFLRGIHLKGNTRKFVEIPINEEMTEEYVKERIK